MFRRAFITGGVGVLAASPVLAAAQAPATPTSRHRLAGSYVTSMAPDALLSLAPGMRLELRRDPQRGFEPGQAVAILTGSRRLGYLPGNTGKMVAALLDKGGHALDAEVVGIRPGDRPAIDIDIYIS